MKRPPEEPCAPMSCPVCTKCCAVLDHAGRPTSRCVFGGPFKFEEVK